MGLSPRSMYMVIGGWRLARFSNPRLQQSRKVRSSGYKVFVWFRRQSSKGRDRTWIIILIILQEIHVRVCAMSFSG